MFKELDAQDNRPPEYVQNKNADKHLNNFILFKVYNKFKFKLI